MRSARPFLIFFGILLACGPSELCEDGVCGEDVDVVESAIGGDPTETFDGKWVDWEYAKCGADTFAANLVYDRRTAPLRVKVQTLFITSSVPNFEYRARVVATQCTNGSCWGTRWSPATDGRKFIEFPTTTPWLRVSENPSVRVDVRPAGTTAFCTFWLFPQQPG
jgi:hypothetical protein